MIYSNEVLSRLYAIRKEVEQKAYRRFAMGLGEAYPDELRQIDEQIAQIEKRVPNGTGFTLAATAPVLLSVEKKETVNIDRIIDKRSGSYYYKGNPIEISNTDTIYFIIFDVVFDLMPDGGFRTYKAIEKEMDKRRVRGHKISRLAGDKAAARIRTNLTSEKNGFFRYANISNSATMGHPLIETKKGAGITFNNRA